MSVFLFADILFKCVAFGLWFHPDAYLKQSFWHILDAIVAIASLLYLFEPLSLAVKCLRALRFVKMLSFIRPTRLVAESLLSALLGLAPVFVFSTILVFAFSVIAVQFFGGYSWQCLLVPDGTWVNISQVDCDALGSAKAVWYVLKYDNY